jgi:hypothetical protein
MNIVAQLAFAYVAGLVIGGIVASLMELASGDEPSFAPPFFSRARRSRFVVAVLAAGPFMLVNDALEARRAGNISVGGLTCLLATASIWAWSIGMATMGAIAGLAS